MRKITAISFILFSFLFGFSYANPEALGAPVSNIFRSLVPETTDTYYVGTTSARWLGLNVKNATTSSLAVTGITNCDTLDTDSNGVVICGTDTGGTFATTSISAVFPINWNTSTAQISFSGISTSTSPTIGHIPFWTGLNTLGSIATGTVSATGPIAVTAGQSIIGSGLTISCPTCSTVTPTFGTTSISALFPIAWDTSNAQISFNGIGTSSAPTIGNLSYWTGVNTLGTVATGTVSASGGITATAGQSIIGSGLTIGCSAASGSVTGCLSSTDWGTFNNKVSSTSLSGASVISYTSSTGVITTTGGTFGSGNYVFPAQLTILSSSTLQNFTALNSTSTNATTTSLAIANVLSTILKTNGQGSVIPAISGTDYEVPLTFGDGLTRTTNDVDCDTASGSVFGCLSSTDWTIFNNKQNTISVTFPITLSGATVGFGGLSTSSAAVVGNIPYFSGVNTFANVATSSVTCTSPVSCTAFNVIGSGSTISLGTIGVANGGTGATTFGQGWLHSDGGTSALTSSTSPTVNYITATSTTATSTFAGGLQAGNSTTGLFFEPNTARLSVGGAENFLTFNGSNFGQQITVHTEGAPAQIDYSAHRHVDSALLGATIDLTKSRGTEALETIVQNGDLIFDIAGLGFDGVDYSETTQIRSEVDGTPGSNDMPGRLVFSTTPDGAQAALERMRITNGGNIGIGTTSPYRKLSVHGNGFIASDLRLSTLTATSTVTGANFVGSSASATSTLAGGFAIETNGLVYNFSTNRVGIGNATPTTALDITGDLKLSTELTISSITGCTGSSALQTNGTGLVSCGTVTGGSGGGSGDWTLANQVVSLATTTNRVVIGASTTPYAKFTVISGSTATTTFALVPETNQTANIIDIYNKSLNLKSVFTIDHYFGIGTSTPTSRLHVAGSFGCAATTTTISFTLTIDECNIAVDASGGARTITLPTAASAYGREYTIKKIDSSVNAVTIDGAGAETIDNATTQSMVVQYTSTTIWSDGDEWWVK